MRQQQPDARTIQTLDDLAAFLRGLRSAAGNLPFRRIRGEIAAEYRRRSRPDNSPSLATVHGYFQNGRVRMNPETVLDIARVLGLDADGLQALDQACRRVLDRASRSLIVATRAAIPDPATEFTGRRAERDLILDVVRAAGERWTVILIEGMAGIGKTELTQQAVADLDDARLIGPTRLFADLRGYDAAEPPAASDAVVRGFLGHLGVPGRRIDALSPAARGTLLHRELAGRRALIVLDNAVGTAQLRPLLPRFPGCVVLVTSRRRLHDLEATVRLSLDVISAPDALQLLRRYDPTGRLDVEPDAMALVELCRRLPLELAAVGRQLANKLDWELSDHIERLKRIPSHEHSGPVLAVSYDGLPRSAQLLFRLLAIHPGRRFGSEDVRALASDLVIDVDVELTRLYDESLLLQRAPDWFEFHDSVRAYATELAYREDPASRQQAAVGNLLRHYRDRLESAGDGEAAAWLSAVRSDLLACLHVPGNDVAVVALAAALHRRLRVLGHYDEARICNQQVLRLARRVGNLGWEGDALSGLAELDRLTGRFRTAADGFETVLRLREQLGDEAGQANALRGLAQISSNDDYPTAAKRYQAALTIHRRLGNHTGEAEVLWGLAEIALSTGDYCTAADHSATVTSICRRIGNRLGEAYGLRMLADAAVEQGQLSAATCDYRRSLAICHQIGNRRGIANALRGLAGVALRATVLDRSDRLFQHALDIYVGIGDIGGEADALRGLAETALARGALTTASDLFKRALPIYRELTDRAGEANTLAGLHQIGRRNTRPDLALG